MNKGTSWLGAGQHPFELVAGPCFALISDF